MKEIEYKFMLSPQTFDRLLLEYNLKNPIKQVNHYFIDSKNELRKNHVTVRIRELDDEKFLQIKYESIGSQTEKILPNNLTIREEYLRKAGSISDVTVEEIERITGVVIENLFNIGSLTTYRYKFKVDDVYLCLDKNFFLDVCDYELEIEIPQGTPIDVENILNKLKADNLNARSMGKCTRFIHRFKELQLL